MQTSFSLTNCEQNLLPKDGEVYLYEQAINISYRSLLESLEWKHEQIRMFERWVYQPRLMAWYGDVGAKYIYSGLLNNPLPWTNELLEIKSQVEEKLGTTFNSVLANYYRDGQDSMGWHQDNEKELGDEPVIASVSLGAIRQFQLKHKSDKSLKTLKLDLQDKSLLVMQGQTQNFWQHQVPKTKRDVGGRINLTFRTINT